MADRQKPELDAERKWRYLIPVSHQFYIYGRQAAEEMAGREGAEKFTATFWRLSGQDTGRMYLELGRLDPEDLLGLAQAISRSSAIMGEETEVRLEGERCFLIHHQCPWPQSYQKYGLPETCQPGCDIFIEALAAVISPKIRVRTAEAIPAGGDKCVREFSRVE